MGTNYLLFHAFFLSQFIKQLTIKVNGGVNFSDLVSYFFPLQCGFAYVARKAFW